MFTESILVGKAKILQFAKLVKDWFVPFHDIIDPWEACGWIEDLENSFKYIACRDVKMHSWPLLPTASNGLVVCLRQTFGIRSISWKRFKDAFESKY